MKNLGRNVKYIGVDDLELDLFEGQYIILEGISYNSYLILDEKVAILDTVDARCADVWFKNLEEALEGREADYLIIHHLEPDHSGLVAQVLAKFPSIKIVASAKAHQILPLYLPEDLKVDQENCVVVSEGDVLDLGEHKLHFIAAPMVHWPEVIVSYDAYAKTLYSADAFGKFGALSKCGFYGRDDEDWTCEGRRYYFNIVGKYGVQVQSLLKKLSAFEISAIRPLHGPLLEDNLEEYFSLYQTWSSYQSETEGTFIAVASIHGGTLAAAEKMAEILRAKGEKVVVSDLSRSDIAENVEDAFRYPRMILAAASYDAGVFSPMADFLHRLIIKGYSNRKIAIIENGSWAPTAAKTMKDMLAKQKNLEFTDTVLTIRGRMKSSDLPIMEKIASELV